MAKTVDEQTLVITTSISGNTVETLNVLESAKKLGIKIEKIKTGEYKIYGKGLGSLFAKKNTVINCFNSGTLARLLLGILSTTPNIEIIMTGDSSLRKRSMKKLILLMSEFGATFLPKNKFNKFKKGKVSSFSTFLSTHI